MSTTSLRDYQQALASHLKVYTAVSNLRASHKFSSTALFSTKEVFAFSRSSDTKDFIVAMNVMEEEVTLSLEEIILMLGGDHTSAKVVVRSSGEDAMSKLREFYSDPVIILEVLTLMEILLAQWLT